MDVQNTNRKIAKEVESRDAPALWGGIECSITRVRSAYQDQLKLAGHYDRPEDIELISSLGIKALRFPILFEKHVPEQGKAIDWTWADDRLKRLKEKEITVIAGLVHHGSGPEYTNLLSAGFATKLASFAKEVATRFPHIEYYTPVNEPLTTARFSGLYGIWYPHHGNDRSFCRMLLNELLAVVLSMRAIRKINPAAKLVQTEDLGKIYAVKNLQYQADFENERRWMTFDLLCGRVDPDHFLWQYFIDNGIAAAELQFFLDNPCPPDIMGVNYYVTSERFLDDNVAAYPPHMVGGNQVERYVDTEAVRVEHDQPSGLKLLLNEINDRYSLPIAITEVHLHCTREEQMRWFRDVWETCCEVKLAGVNLQAVTAWSLFGAFGWNKLLTSPECDYEPGVFDLRSPQPRETALAQLLRSYTNKISYDHPVLNQPGWWKRNSRFFPHFYANGFPRGEEVRYDESGIVIVGKGMLADAMVHACNGRAIPHIHIPDSWVFGPDCNNLPSELTNFNSWGIIYTEFNSSAGQPGAVGADALSTLLAKFCNDSDKQFLVLVQARQQESVAESDGLIGDVEENITKECSKALLVRTGLLFSPWDNTNFAFRIIEMLRAGKRVKASEVTLSNYSYVPDVVHSALDLMIDGAVGITHLVHPEKISLFDFAMELSKHSGMEVDQVLPSNKPSGEGTLLSAERFRLMPSVYCAIEHFAKNSSSLSASIHKELVKTR